MGFAEYFWNRVKISWSFKDHNGCCRWIAFLSRLVLINWEMFRCSILQGFYVCVYLYLSKLIALFILMACRSIFLLCMLDLRFLLYLMIFLIFEKYWISLNQLINSNSKLSTYRLPLINFWACWQYLLLRMYPPKRIRMAYIL